MFDFVWQYLIGPIVAEARDGTAVWNGVEAVAGYNLYNTVAWALIGISIVLFLSRAFEKYDIDLNPEKALNLIPLILLAGVLRFVQDAVNLPLIFELLLITPIIYIWVAGLAIVLILLEQFEDLSFKYFNVFALLAASGIILLLGTPLLPLTGILIGSGAAAGVYYYVLEDSRYQSLPLVFMVMSQFFEGFSSIYGLTQGYEPRQLLTSTFVDLMGPLGFLMVKILILGFALKMYFDLEKSYQSILLIALYSIGFATGIRVVLRASLGV